MTHPRFKILKSARNEYSFNLTGPNGAIILSSTTCASYNAVVAAILSTKVKSRLQLNYGYRVTDLGKHFFLLKGAAHEVLGTSPLHDSQAAMELCASAVMACAFDARTEE